MDEVDNIIIHTFRQIGCDIPEEVSNLREFTTSMIVTATSKCIRMIKEDLQIPSVLPASMSSRFRLGTSLAAACQEVGYRGEIGYQTFLYSNEADIRKLFMFLVENLPKESSEAASEPLGSSVVLNRRIAAKLMHQMSKPWTPSFCKIDGISWSGTKPRSWHKEGTRSARRFYTHKLRMPKDLLDLTKKIPRDVKLYYSAAMPFITTQPACREDVPPSILETNAMAVTLANEWENEWNQSGLASWLSKEEYLAQKKERLEKKMKRHLQNELQRSNLNSAATTDLNDIVSALSDRASGTGTPSKGSRFTRTEQLQFAQDEQKAAAMVGLSEEGPPKVDTEEEMRQKREEEIASLQSKLSELNASLEHNEQEIKKSAARIQQTNEQTANQTCRNSEQEEAFKVKKRTVDLLPDAENNIVKLESVVDVSAERLVNLAQQWEKHRVPLIEQYRELKQMNANRVSEAQKQLEEIKSLREKMKEVADEARGKEDLYKQLVVEFETMRKGANRAAYTRRISEIVGNIKKQKEEINKILIDTKDAQKEINQLSGKLDRTFIVTDELIFKDAKKDEFCKKAYKYLASLHENCKELIRSVEDSGTIVREIRDLEDQIETESQKNTATNLERITADLKQMKEENNTLMKKLKALKS